MSKRVVRKSDLCSGHSCWNPRPPTSWSSNVFINNLNCIRVGDTWDVHCCDGSCHTGTSISGSSTVFVNGKRIFRKGDAIDCGSVGDESSQNVFAGG